MAAFATTRGHLPHPTSGHVWTRPGTAFVTEALRSGNFVLRSLFTLPCFFSYVWALVWVDGVPSLSLSPVRPQEFFRSFIPSCACACPHYHFRAESPSLSMGSVECRAPPRSRPRRPSRGTVAYPSAPHHTTTLPPTMPHLRALEGVSPGGAPPQRPRRPTPRPPPHAAAPATRWPPGQTPARPP